MVVMGARRPRRGSRLCKRWALRWREDGALLGQYLRATKSDTLSDGFLLDFAHVFVYFTAIEQEMTTAALGWALLEANVPI